MIITLPTPDLYFDKRIQQIAVQHGCYASVKWVTAREVRFVLVERAMSRRPATFEQHDAVIAALLALVPEARIAFRTDGIKTGPAFERKVSRYCDETRGRARELWDTWCYEVGLTTE